MSINLRHIRFLVLLAAVVLSGCGFYLRGSGSQAALPFQTIYLSNAESQLGIALKRSINNQGGTTVVADPKMAQAILDVTAESRDKAILSLNSQGRVREYTLSYRVAFRVKDNKENELLAPTEINLRRTLSFNEAQVLAKETEEATLFRDMQIDMVQQILRRVAAIKPADTASSLQGVTSTGTTTTK
jgi:LPS-assembly lipoprotein